MPNDDSDINGEGCLQPVLFMFLGALALLFFCWMGWFNFDATLDGDVVTDYAPEPIEHCSLKAEDARAAAAARMPVESHFVWLDWDANPVSDQVDYYTLYIGKATNPPAKLKLGNQTSIRVIRNHPDTYARITASNAVGESPKSNEVHFTTP